MKFPICFPFVLCFTSAINAATLTIDPNPLTRSATATLTLNIAAITAGDVVRVETFADLNGNGIADRGEPLVQSFDVADGPAPRIGGKQLASIPADADGAANGQISIRFSPSSGAEIAQLAGKYVVRLSSPSNHFTALAKSFEILPAAYTQSIRGNVTAAGVAAAGAEVIALAPSGDGDRFVAGVMADASGQFSLPLPPGSYRLIAFKSGNTFSFQTAPEVTLATGQTLTVPLALLPALRAISGKVQDSATQLGIPGLSLFFESETGEFALATTDSTGAFNVPVSAANWKVNPSRSSARLLGYLVPQDDAKTSTVAGNATLTISLRKADALIYGTLLSPQGQPLAGIEIRANDTPQQLSESSSLTAADGAFSLGVNSGTWSVEAKDNSVPISGLLILSTNISVSSGQAVEVHLPTIRAAAHISGRVLDENNQPVSDLTVVAGSSDRTVYLNATTDSQGNFSFNVPAGTWTVFGENQSARDHNLVVAQGQVTVQDNATQTLNLTAYHQNATISGNLRSDDGSPIPNAQIYAFTTRNGSQINANANTDGQGHFNLQVFPSTWQVGTSGLGQLGLIDTSQSVQVNSPGSNVSLDLIASHTQPAEPLTLNLPLVLPDARLGLSYVTHLDASGGVQPYSWSLAPRSPQLPAGLALAPSGDIEGVPQSAGTFSFLVRVTDASAPKTSADASLNLVVVDPASTASWTTKASLLLPTVSPTVVGFNGTVFVIGGFSDQTGPLSTVEVFHPAQNTWTTAASMRTPRGRTASGVIGTQIYVAGGFGGTEVLEAFDPAANVWSAKARLLTPISGAVGGVINVQFYVAGGTADFSKSLEAYNPTADSWTLKSPMLTPRMSSAGAVINDKLYVAGGYHAVFGGSPLGNLEVYDPATDTWAAKAPMPIPQAENAGAAINGKLYVFGGSNPDSEVLQIYDPATDRWSFGPSAPTERAGVSATAIGQTILAAGGTQNGPSNPLAIVEQFGPDLAGSPILSQVIVLKTDASTRAAVLPTLSFPDQVARLDSGNWTNLTFQLVSTTVSGTPLPALQGAPPETVAVALPGPTAGASGFLRWTFTLPDSFHSPQLNGAANARTFGRMFLNGKPISPAVLSSDANRISETGNARFAASGADLFHAGSNELLLSVLGSGSGVSTAVAYAFIQFEPGAAPGLKKIESGAFLLNGHFKLALSGTPGDSAAVESSTDLQQWFPLGGVTLNNGTGEFTDADAPRFPRRFYRVK